MIIPNAHLAVVDIRKLRAYCLDPTHPEGKHKAHLFQAALGMNADNAEALCTILLEAIQTQEAVLGRRDEYGQRYTLDFQLEWNGRTAVVRSGWIIEHSSAVPRLTTCFPR
jgi:hypothetical protein